MPEVFGLDADGIRKLRDLLRRVEMLEAAQPRRPTERAIVPPRKLWYRIVSASTDPVGKYLVRRQQWNATGHAWEDTTDAHDPEYNLDVVAYDVAARGGGAADDRVQGWKACVDGVWVTLIDVGSAVGGGVFAVRVAKDGGVSGGIAAECTWTYTVKDLAGNILNKVRGGASAPAWSGATTYGVGAKVVEGTKLYEGLQAANLNHTPSSSPTWWTDLGVGPAVGMTPVTPRQHFLEYWYAGETRTAPAVPTSLYGEAVYDGDDLVLLRCAGEISKDSPCEE